jgi:type I restriction-modification system specificity subunit (fragment)
MKCKLSDICVFRKGKVDVSKLTLKTYISTENMLPNKGGVTEASSLPTVQLTQEYKKGDILVSNIRPYFKKIWQAKCDGGCSNDVLVFQGNSNIDGDFLYYILANDDFFAYSMATSKGTKMPRGDKTSIMQYEVPIFDIDTQRKIASVLRSLDEKIELNSTINNNLEQQAQAIFKEWFIDNPENNEWSTGTFSELIKSTLNGDWGKEAPTGNNTEKVYCIRGADIPEVKAGNKGKMPTRYILPKNFAAKQLAAGDIVVEISGGSPTQSTGRCTAITQSLLDRYDSGMVCTNFCKAMKPKEGYSLFIYYYWQYLYGKGVFFSYENGTTGIKNLDFSGFIETETILIPPVDKIIAFDDYCKSIFNQIFANGKQNEHLAVLRDTLLPKLMSGELDVSDMDL